MVIPNPKLVPFDFEYIRFCFEATIPTDWYEVTEREFDYAMENVNWNRAWYSNCCIYKEYNKTLGVYDEKTARWFLNPDYFTKTLDPVTSRVMIITDEGTLV